MAPSRHALSTRIACLEGARPLRLILKQKGIHLKLPEQLLRNGIVAALGVPLAAVVASTEVDGEDHACALGTLQTRVVDTNRLVQRLVGVQPHLVFDVVPPLRIYVVAVAGRVDLHVMYPFAHQRLNFRLDDGNDVPQQIRMGGIDLIRDAFFVMDGRKLVGGG